jgi:hypothetical protein
MTNKSILAAAFALAGLAAGANTSAASYIGATVGQSHWDEDCAGTASCKKNATAFKVFGGYTFDQAWGVEASYFDLGKVHANLGTLRAESSATGGDIAAVVRAPFGADWEMSAKFGLAYVKGETTASTGNFRGTVSKNSAQPVAGVGIGYKVSDNLRARADLQSTRVKLIDGNGGTGSIFTLGAGLQLAF